MTFIRYALYYAPPDGADWSRFCTRWLGWDMTTGKAVAPPDMPPLPLTIEEITRTPRKYGLHATLKPPFRLADGTDRAGLEAACTALAKELAPFEMDALHVTRLGRFIALSALGDARQMKALGDACVRTLDPFRLPPPEAELDRRRAAGLSARQEENLRRWGYPYVMEDFRFHITLSGPLETETRIAVANALDTRLSPLLPTPFYVNDIALVGEAADGQFHLIRRFPLG